MKRTGRHPRIHIPNSIHHVMIRGNNRQCVFFNDDYFNCFLKIVMESAKKFDHKILAFCLMSNHAHLLIHIHKDTLANIMKNINYRYARWLNHKQHRIGHLFQGRYRSIAVNNETYLINLCRYIHYNPVEAKIVSNPNNYEWSSHHYYSTQNSPEWMNIDFILAAIKNKISCSYDDFINEPVNREKWKPGFYISENGDCVIDEDIVRNLNTHDIQEKTKNKSLPQAIVSEIVCRHLNINYDRLLSASRDRKTSYKRMLLAHFWLSYSNLKVLDIAKQFCRTHGTILRQLNRFRINNHQHIPEDLLQKIQMELDVTRER